MRKQLLPDNPHWQVLEQIDPETYEMKNRYYYQGEEADRVVLTSKLARQLCGYLLIEKDLRNIIEWFDRLKSNLVSEYGENDIAIVPVTVLRPDAALTKALFVAAVTFYGKLFTKAEGRRVSLHESWIEDASLRDAHQDLISARHNFTAHSGEGADEYANLIVASKRVSKGNVAKAVATELKQPVAPTADQIDLFIRLARYLQDRVMAKIAQLKQKVLEELEIKIGP